MRGTRGFYRYLSPVYCVILTSAILLYDFKHEHSYQVSCSFQFSCFTLKFDQAIFLCLFSISRVEVVMASPGLQRSVSKPRISSSSSSSNTSRAFYEPPPDRQTAAQIVRESREWLQAVSTRRPYTPRNQPRSLFGPSYKPISSKPSRNVKVHVRS